MAYLTPTYNLTDGMAWEARQHPGGIAEIYLANASIFIQDCMSSSGLIQGGILDTTGTLPGQPDIYIVIPKKFSASIVETPKVTEHNSTTYQQVLKFEFLRRDSYVINLIEILGKGEFRAMIKFNDGTTKYYGERNGLVLTAGPFTTNEKPDAVSGWTITMEAIETQPAQEMNYAMTVGLYNHIS